MKTLIIDIREYNIMLDNVIDLKQVFHVFLMGGRY